MAILAIGPLHTGNNIAQYNLHSSVCAGNCVVCNGGICNIAQNGMRSCAVQKFGRRPAQLFILRMQLNQVCKCVRVIIAQSFIFIQFFTTVQEWRVQIQKNTR